MSSVYSLVASVNSVKNESIHRASPVHSQQEYIATELALYKKYTFTGYTLG